MGAAVDTAKVTGRRKLHFDSLADIRADVERLAAARELRTLGNWSAGQIFQHLATVMNKSIDGFTARPPLPIRWLLTLLFKRRFLTTPMTAGFKLPAGAQKELVCDSLDCREATGNLLKALDRLDNEAH